MYFITLVYSFVHLYLLKISLKLTPRFSHSFLRTKTDHSPIPRDLSNCTARISSPFHLLLFKVPFPKSKVEHEEKRWMGSLVDNKDFEGCLWDWLCWVRRIVISISRALKRGQDGEDGGDHSSSFLTNRFLLFADRCLLVDAVYRWSFLISDSVGYPPISSSSLSYLRSIGRSSRLSGHRTNCFPEKGSPVSKPRCSVRSDGGDQGKGASFSAAIPRKGPGWDFSLS